MTGQKTERKKAAPLMERAESGGIVSRGCNWDSFLWCAGNNGATWSEHGTIVGARGEGEAGQDTKKERPSAGHSCTGEGRTRLVTTKKGSVKERWVRGAKRRLTKKNDNNRSQPEDLA